MPHDAISSKISVDSKESEELKYGVRVWKHLLAGSTAAIASRTVTAPLDRLKTIAQASSSKVTIYNGLRTMIKEGGISSMWRAMPEVTIRFVTFNELKHVLVKDRTHELTTAERMIAGGVSGLIAHSIVHPIEVVKTRFILHNAGKQNNFTNTLIKGYKTEGYRFLFRGYVTSIFGILIFSSIDFSTYESLKKMYKKRYGPSAFGQEVVFCSMVSSVVAQSFAYPFAVIGVHLQTVGRPAKWRDIRKFVFSRGAEGLYRGFGIALLRGVPTFATAYFSYELILSMLNEQMI
ncbi:calcium-binding mitochondrial carrier protein SCaMC-1-like isoform X2 [Cimex lectularius]|uniref:Mitochondrial carrier protein n=1 Tax=Cimex lectularius TaxID=79782 RepID=A0A8I6S247_CIMLE|nr:calcium-binding mitochondrial carrier protein SCaMC-1-like isoform X2 [Cimex lectularius]